MGQAGMSDMAEMSMPGPANTAPMGVEGPFDTVIMGGMSTVVKIRHEITAESAASWYKHPPEQVAKVATKDELEKDDIKIGGTKPDTGKEPHKH